MIAGDAANRYRVDDLGRFAIPKFDHREPALLVVVLHRDSGVLAIGTHREFLRVTTHVELAQDLSCCRVHDGQIDFSSGCGHYYLLTVGCERQVTQVVGDLEQGRRTHRPIGGKRQDRQMPHRVGADPNLVGVRPGRDMIRHRSDLEALHPRDLGRIFGVDYSDTVVAAHSDDQHVGAIEYSQLLRPTVGEDRRASGVAIRRLHPVEGLVFLARDPHRTERVEGQIPWRAGGTGLNRTDRQKLREIDDRQIRTGCSIGTTVCDVESPVVQRERSRPDSGRDHRQRLAHRRVELDVMLRDDRDRDSPHRLCHHDVDRNSDHRERNGQQPQFSTHHSAFLSRMDRDAGRLWPSPFRVTTRTWRSGENGPPPRVSDSVRIVLVGRSRLPRRFLFVLFSAHSARLWGVMRCGARRCRGSSRSDAEAFQMSRWRPWSL